MQIDLYRRYRQELTHGSHLAIQFIMRFCIPIPQDVAEEQQFFADAISFNNLKKPQ